MVLPPHRAETHRPFLLQNRRVADSSDDKPTTPAGAKPLVGASAWGGHASSERDTDDETARSADAALVRAASSIDLRAPRFEERYGYQSALGKGGMGEVHAYLDRRMGRTIAVKVALADPERGAGAQEAFAARFIHEARVQARLEHPAVVPVYDLGLGADGQPYITMKRVLGATMAEIVAQLAEGELEAEGRYSQRRLLTAFSQVCLAVHFAHERGVLHRDLKPANVMFGDFGEVYVLDWGVASTSEPGDASQGQRPGLIIGVAGGGTSGYLAPERIAGERESAPASDVYSLGAILYELLTLQPLNPGKTAQARAVAALNGEQLTPSERAPQRSVAPELDVICMRATAADPEHRYSTARRLHEAIEGYLDGERDDALRTELAKQHAVAALDAADRLLTADGAGGLQERSEVLRDVGRALALDPNNEIARETMVRLLTTPPSEAPAEVIVAQEQAARQRRVWTGRAAIVAYLSLLLYWPFFWWAGVRDMAPLLTYSAMGIAAAAVCAFVVYRRGGTEPWILVAMATSTIAVLSTASLFGPLVLMPAAIATNAAAYVMNLSRRARAITVASAMVAIAGPVVLEWLGVLAPSYRFDDGGMTIIPNAIELSGNPATALLLAAALGSVLTATLSMGHLRSSLDRAERRILMYTWHFRNLAPGNVSLGKPPQQ